MLTVTLPPELEIRLRSQAAREGLAADAYIVRALEQVLPPQVGSVLGRREAELLQQINLGISEVQWSKYRLLRSKREIRALSADEHRELIALCDEIEVANARRMPTLIELAALRNVPLKRLMNDLGLGNGREAGIESDGD